MNDEIWNLNLSPRANRILGELGITTVKDFMSLKSEAVIKTPGIGTNTWFEIEEKQHELRQSPDAQIPNATELAIRECQELGLRILKITEDNPDLSVNIIAGQVMIEQIIKGDAA